MSIETLVDFLERRSGKIVYMRSLPEIFDFTDRDSSNTLEIVAQDGSTLSVSMDSRSLPLVVSILKLTVFSGDRKLLAWNFKQFCTFVAAKTGHVPQIDCAVIDLKVLESYTGNRGGTAPKTFSEAMGRLRRLVESGDYRLAENAYRNVHLPLMKLVLPTMEATGIIDSSRSLKVYSYYEIDGQENGRLKCHDAYRNGFVPHTMGEAVRESLKPLSYDDIFMSFDFRGMEVYVLANLSNDPMLSRLCIGQDIYCGIYEAITGQPCNDSAGRDFAKKVFLPVIYGQGATAVAARMSIPKSQADSVVGRIRSEFAVANEYVMDRERQLASSGFVRDDFGKVRRGFPPGKDYLARNFAVQAPASTICSEKLINLYFALKDKARIAYTVHDGYVVYVDKADWREIHSVALKILTAESSLKPGLRLKVSCRGGRNLNSLKAIRSRG